MVNCKRSKTIFVIPSSLTVGLAILILIVVTSCAIPIEKPTPYPAQSDQTSLITPTQDQTEPINTPTSQAEPNEELPELVETPEKEEPVEPEVTDQPTQTETKPVDLGQIKFDHPMSPGLFLTYDTAKWEIQMNYFLGSKQYPECRIADFGPLNAPPGEEGKHTYEEMTEFVGNIEYLLEKRIVKDTGIADAMKIYFEKNGNYWKYAFRLGFGTDNYDECVAAFWEVMELSQANNFSQVPSLEP